MLMTRSELLEKIRLGEDSFLEFKEVRIAGSKVKGPGQDALADELAAFANSKGGELLLGVKDGSHEVLGIPLNKMDDVERVAQEACEHSIKPALFPVIERLTLPDAAGVEQPVIRIAVERSLFVHQSPGGYLHRVGSSKRPMAPDQLARLFQQRSQSRLIRFDETPVMAATLDALDADLWQRFAPPKNTDSPEILLRKLAMAAQDERGVWHPTVAGILMATREPQQFLRTAYVQAVAYRGTTVVPQDEKVYQLDARDITGPLDQQILDACAFVRRNMRISAFKRKEGGRVDVPAFVMSAVFEAMTNAVAHRDYSMPGSKVRLRLFDDRLELYTPGMLPNTMTTDALPLRQAARNEAIASLLARCSIADPDLASHRTHIMDRRGEGVPVILDRSEQLSGRKPEYRLVGDSELLLTIYAANAGQSA